MRQSWIPVSKRMPEDLERVLVYYPLVGGDHDSITVDFAVNGKFTLQGDDNYFGQPTHWMPLPDKPKVTK